MTAKTAKTRAIDFMLLLSLKLKVAVCVGISFLKTQSVSVHRIAANDIEFKKPRDPQLCGNLDQLTVVLASKRFPLLSNCSLGVATIRHPKLSTSN